MTYAEKIKEVFSRLPRNQDRLLLLTLVMLANNKGEVNTSRQILMLHTGMTESQIRYSFGRILKEFGLTAESTRDGTIVNLQTINLFEWVDEMPQKDTDLYTKVVELYNTICTALPKASKLTDGRKRAINARAKEYGKDYLEIFGQVFKRLNNSPHHTGNNSRGWKANLDWIMNPSNFVKFYEQTTNITQKEEPDAEEKFNYLMRKRYRYCSLVQHPLSYRDAIQLKKEHGEKVYQVLDKFEANKATGIIWMCDEIRKILDNECNT